MQLRQFLIRLGLTILLPIVIIGVIFEVLFRNIPNTHEYKKEYMDVHAEDIEVLILGNSHAFDGINPQYLSYSSFNLAYHAQEFVYDKFLVEKYIERMHSLKCLVFTMSYFTLFEDDMHGWRANKYRLYCDIDNGVKLSESLECLKNDNFKFFVDFYFEGKNLIICDSLGNAKEYEYFPYYDWEANGKGAALRHTLYSEGKGIMNLYILEAIKQLQEKYDVKVIFITFPAWQTYIQNLDRRQYMLMQQIMDKLTQQDSDIFYYNFLGDTTFVQSDFFNVDHLNERGAVKMTRKLNKILQSVLKD